jgi:hypothetical protein
LKGQYPEKKAVGKPRLQCLKQVARNTAAESYKAMKKGLATIAVGKLPTNQMEGGGGGGGEEEQEVFSETRSQMCVGLQVQH